MPYNGKHVSVIIPAHNEEGSIANVVSDIAALTMNTNSRTRQMTTGTDQSYETRNIRLVDDIIVCDNDSDDNTANLALNAGASVVYESQKGYGAACLRGIQNLNPKTQFVIFVDGDSSVNPMEIEMLLQRLTSGADIVIGNRENNKLEKGALSIHQRFGNWLASLLIRTLWKHQVSDLGPFRAIRYSALLALDMQDKAFGWTVEMQVKAIQAQFSYQEVDVSTKPRIGKSKISGTLKGTIGAALGIFSTIFHLYWNEKEFLNSKLIQQSLKSRFKT